MELSISRLEHLPFDKGTAEAMLTFMHEFNEAASKIGYITAQELHSGLEQLLSGTALDEWATIKSNVTPGTITLNSWNERINEFKKSFIPDPSAVENQKLYLRKIKKTDKFTVPKFLERIKLINMLLAQFPDASDQDKLSDDEIKQSPFQRDGKLTSWIRVSVYTPAHLMKLSSICLPNLNYPLFLNNFSSKYTKFSFLLLEPRNISMTCAIAQIYVHVHYYTYIEFC